MATANAPANPQTSDNAVFDSVEAPDPAAAIVMSAETTNELVVIAANALTLRFISGTSASRLSLGVRERVFSKEASMSFFWV
jgi:hypothetical protein